jgi:hypothetical protein
MGSSGEERLTDSALPTFVLGEPLCPRCVASQGLCAGCAAHDKAILPQIAVNTEWLKMMGGPDYTPPSVVPRELPDLNVPGRKSARRTQRNRELRTRHGLALAATPR